MAFKSVKLEASFNPVKLEASINPVKLEASFNPVKLEASFEEVDFHDLQVGVKYMIKDLPERYSYHTGIFKEHNGILEVFEKVIYHGPFGSYKDFERQFVHKFYYALVSQKEKIQQSMEKRALHKILRGLLDPHFTWE
jgi:hypothetical protein